MTPRLQPDPDSFPFNGAPQSSLPGNINKFVPDSPTVKRVAGLNPVQMRFDPPMDKMLVYDGTLIEGKDAANPGVRTVTKIRFTKSGTG